MLDRYIFKRIDTTGDGLHYEVNNHKVNSGVWTMLMLKCIEDSMDRYSLEYEYQSKYESPRTDYHSYTVTKVFSLKDYINE